MLTEIVSYGVLLAGLIYAAYSDWRTLTLPRLLLWILCGVWLGLHGVDVCLALASDSALAIPELVTLAASLSGACSVAAILLLIRLLMDRRLGRMSLGSGDVWLVAIVCLYLGMGRTLVALVVACVVAILMAWVLPRMRWKPNGGSVELSSSGLLNAVPFVPALLIGTLVSLGL